MYVPSSPVCYASTACDTVLEHNCETSLTMNVSPVVPPGI